jgi:hypothetical protein
VTFWTVREELSQANRLRRSYYELLRDELDQFMLQYALVDSYDNFLRHKLAYPFVEKRELRPRARIPDIEYEHQNAFLLIFSEDSIPAAQKKYVRFLDVNRTSKSNLLRSKTLPLARAFDRTQKYLDAVHFLDFLRAVLPVDYALLVQREPTTRLKDRYCLTHFHVRVDWPVAEAAEDLARRLRYISKDLYEKGDKVAEDLQKRFFEYYGLPVMAGGRRTAAVVAAQYLRRNGCIATVYAGSSESRALLRISERGVSKVILMKFTPREVAEICEANHLSPATFRKHYLIAAREKGGIGIFQATYELTDHARPPDDGKLRDLKPDVFWLTVGGQFLLPRPGVWKYPPLPLNAIYS